MRPKVPAGGKFLALGDGGREIRRRLCRGVAPTPRAGGCMRVRRF